jgi:hypothetical protein
MAIHDEIGEALYYLALASKAKHNETLRRNLIKRAVFWIRQAEHAEAAHPGMGSPAQGRSALEIERSISAQDKV